MQQVMLTVGGQLKVQFNIFNLKLAYSMFCWLCQMELYNYGHARKDWQDQVKKHELKVQLSAH